MLLSSLLCEKKKLGGMRNFTLKELCDEIEAN